MKRAFSTVCLGAALVFSVVACSRPAATVNGEKIERETLELHVKEKMQEHQQRSAAVTPEMLRQGVLQQLIDERLMLAEARTRGIAVKDEELNATMDAMEKNVGKEGFEKALKEKGLSRETFRARTREKLTMTRFIQSLVPDDAVTEDEVSAFYRNSPRPFVKSARVLMNMIEFPTEEHAAAALQQMKEQKTDFDDYAKKVTAADASISATKGWTSADFFGPPISEAMKELRVGSTGGPYRGKKGYYLIRIDGRDKETIASYDEVKPNIRAMLLDQKRQEALAQWLEGKKKESKIVINLK